MNDENVKKTGSVFATMVGLIVLVIVFIAVLGLLGLVLHFLDWAWS